MELKMKMEGEQPYVIIRGDRSGVFAGYLVKWKKQHVKLRRSRRLWYWKGAASLSQLAIDGVKYPEECKFPDELPDHDILDVVEVIPCSERSYESILSVKPWRAE